MPMSIVNRRTGTQFCGQLDRSTLKNPQRNGWPAGGGTAPANTTTRTPSDWRPGAPSGVATTPRRAAVPVMLWPFTCPSAAFRTARRAAGLDMSVEMTARAAEAQAAELAC